MIKSKLFNQICTETVETCWTGFRLPTSQPVGISLIATALSLLDTKALGPEGGVGSI